MMNETKDILINNANQNENMGTTLIRKGIKGRDLKMASFNELYQKNMTLQNLS